MHDLGSEENMTVKDMIQELRADFPEETACNWDNTGFQVGEGAWEVQTVYIALDATSTALEEAISVGAELVLTHHPLIFSGLKQVNDQNFISARVVRMLTHGMAGYAMHTNFDCLVMADLAAHKMNIKKAQPLEVLGERNGKPYGIGCIGSTEHLMTLQECAEKVKEAFSLTHIKAFGNLEQSVQRIAIVPGSGEDCIAEAIRQEADVLITGDIKHHPGIDAVEQKLAILDAGHYGLEHIFVDYMKEYMEQKFPNLKIVAQKLTMPFQII